MLQNRGFWVALRYAGKIGSLKPRSDIGAGCRGLGFHMDFVANLHDTLDGSRTGGHCHGNRGTVFLSQQGLLPLRRVGLLQNGLRPQVRALKKPADTAMNAISRVGHFGYLVAIESIVTQNVSSR